MTSPSAASAITADDGALVGRSTTPFGSAQAVPLAHALVDAVSRQGGIRSLAIKGPTLAFHGLRAEHSSTDADVLVSPSDFELLSAALTVRGWLVKATRSVPGALPSHSRSLHHPSWPVDIDVHSYYPGFFGDPQQTFDLLWEHRVTANFGHQQVIIAGRAGSAIISALHSHRHPRSVGHISELENLTAIVRTGLSAAERAQILALVKVGRAQTVLAGFLTDIGVGEGESDLTAKEFRRWTYYRSTHDDGATGGWLLALGEARWRDRPALLARAILPSPKELRSEREFAGLRGVQLVPVYVSRLARGVAAFPAARAAAVAMMRAAQRARQAARRPRRPRRPRR